MIIYGHRSKLLDSAPIRDACPSCGTTGSSKEAVRGDSVVMRAGKYASDRAVLSKLKAKGDEAYSEDLGVFSKQEFKEMLDKGEVMEIDRK